MVNLVSYYGKVMPRDGITEDDSTYNNIGDVCDWLEEQKETILAAQERLSAFCEIGDLFADEFDIKWEYPTIRMTVPFKLLEYNEGLVLMHDKAKHPTFQNRAVVHIREHILELWAGPNEHPTFTFKYGL